MESENYRKWAGLVEVSQNPGVEILGIGRCAHVTVIAWCTCHDTFRTLVSNVLAENGLRVESMEEVEPCDDRAKKFRLPAAFVSSMEIVGPNHLVEFLEFHTFPCGSTM